VNVLTWHGAVLRADRVRNRLVQDPIWMTQLDGLDFEAAGDPIATPLGPVQLIPGERPGTVRFGSAGQYLTAAPTKHELALQDDEGQALQTFLLIRPDDLADLRHLLSHRWRVAPSQRLLQKADVSLSPGFSLVLGSLVLDLAACLPLGSQTRQPRDRRGIYVPPPSYTLPLGDPNARSIERTEGGVAAFVAAPEIELFARRDDPTLMLPVDQTLLTATNAHLRLEEDEYAVIPPPIMMTTRDQTLFGDIVTRQADPAISTRVRRELSRYVCLARGAEGLVFDRTGVSTDLSALLAAPELPPGFTRHNSRLWLDRTLMDNAPRLSGPHVVFYDSFMLGFEHWMAGAMPALEVLMAQAPRMTPVLLPSGLSGAVGTGVRFDHREVMAASGFSQVRVVESAAPVVLVDDLIYVADPAIGALPRDILREFRDKTLQRLDGRGEPINRIYLKPAQGGPPAIEQFLLRHGFEPVRLEHMPAMQQLALFRSAAFVVGTFGLGLANILFAPPGLRVLELVEGDFRPDIWRLAGKMGHIHGLLGLPDTAAFEDLFAAMEAFQPT